MKTIVHTIVLLTICIVNAVVSAPVIGIYPTGTSSYLSAYKKWVGQFGASSLVMPKSASSEELEELFHQINGFLIPGGSSSLAPFAKSMIDRAIKANGEGDYFPVWGTCLGFEWIIESIGGTSAITGGFDSEDLPQKLMFTTQSPGRIFATANSSLMQWFSTENITINFHTYGITPDSEAHNTKLNSFFDVLATSLDRKGKAFVAMIEGKKVPIYGSQFHPEKIQYVAGHHIPKTPEAIAGAKYLANFFVTEAKKNNHSTF